jgi:hypothetical protein
MTMFQAFLKPKPGMTILDPGDRNRPLPEEGKLVHEFESYWTRQLEAGDVSHSEPKAEKKSGAAQ